ncbi:unnamed protein product [Aureobasidium uvarum]|uniref:Uncharacterized protein n=1 Tax=Aureobasidium uvarum TaxID=2773716 RepID=A0A9N8K841_9PEZI|nr:unnamed protein product [Aureobasidium uvarum]
MSLFLLFCLAEIPVSVINTLLQTPKHNFFSVVRDPAQTTFDPFHTSPPITTPVSKFLDREQIRRFITTRLSEPPAGSDLELCQYALLDERSASDHTLILAHSYSSLDMRDPDTMSEDEFEQLQTEIDDHEDGAENLWFEWRVAFGDAEMISTYLCFESDFTVKLYNEDFVAMHTDARGIFQVKSAYGAFVDTDL